ncbi:MAG: KTSC domain-containing protein [Chitinophagales bacterium]
MKRKAITSTELAAVGYDNDKEILEVEFKNGAVYQFQEVPEYEYSAMLKAPLPAKYFNTYIRNDYEFKRLENEE